MATNICILAPHASSNKSCPHFTSALSAIWVSVIVTNVYVLLLTLRSSGYALRRHPQEIVRSEVIQVIEEIMEST